MTITLYYKNHLRKSIKQLLLGDVNTDLLNFDTSDHINTFLDDLASNSLQPQILLPTKVCKKSKTLIDNIFCNKPNPLVQTAISRNISSTISDHLPLFLILPDFFSNSIPTKYNIISYFLRILKRQIGIKFSN